MISRKNRQLMLLISWAAVILWMAFIFALSAQPREQSNQLSVGITEKIVDAVERAVPDREIDIERFNVVVRKNAHFFAYLVLGVLVANGLRVSGIKGPKVYIWALLICILYAASDEVHQLFVPGRGGQVRDVVIDTVGGTVGLLLYRLLKKN
ncbi:MAG: VanZ family protein [Clostridia bacterium]|nr:VanZ family protein [Clostridia bacterium]